MVLQNIVSVLSKASGVGGGWDIRIHTQTHTQTRERESHTQRREQRKNMKN